VLSTPEDRERPSESQELHSRLLILLASKGELVREQLQVINDNWGLDYFRVAPVNSGISDVRVSAPAGIPPACTSDGEGEYDSRVCGPLILSLPEQTQVFVFHAILAADVVNTLFEGQVPPKLGLALYAITERAAPEYLRYYLNQTKSSLTSPSNISILDEVKQRTLPEQSEKIDPLATIVEDIGDSLKAGQMEIFRLLRPATFQEKEIAEDLKAYLGKDLYGSLTSNTQRILCLAEKGYRAGLEKDDFRAAILDFHQAYQIEFRHRISRFVSQRLAAEKIAEYPPTGDRKLWIAKKGMHSMPDLGEQVHYLKTDEKIRAIVSAEGWDVAGICKCVKPILDSRNDAAHHRPVNLETVDKLRKGLRESFAMLISKAHRGK